MTTNIRRGRDPEQHEMHTPAQAAQIAGRLGQITIAHEAGFPVALHVHNGAIPGGAVIKLEDPRTTAGMLPNAKVVPVVAVVGAVAAQNFTVNHQLGYEPAVVVLDSAGHYAACAIVHDDVENVTVTFDVAGDYKIYIR